MSEIVIPFLPVWKDVMLNGIKTHTCRSKKYGEIGDTFRKFGATFQIISIERVDLKTVRDKFWAHEGCTSPTHFEQVWVELHPERGYVPSDKRWLYEFVRVQ